MDEIHTPDSSRFWVKKTYLSRFKKGLEPENFDKEFLRIWYAKKGYKGDGPPPKMSRQLIVDMAKRYIGVYEKITGKKYKAGDDKESIAFRVLADHIRAIGFTIADGQLPSNTGAGYVIRRILRRSAGLGTRYPLDW